MKILIIYDKFSTFTNAVLDHLNAFSHYSAHRCKFLHIGHGFSDVVLNRFDVVVVHYSVRLPFGGINKKQIENLNKYRGVKVLFLQDEYDNTEKTRGVIAACDFNIVFTCVPKESIEEVYPKDRFSSTKFISCLTGYVSAESAQPKALRPLANRPIDIGYRGRRLPFWYGDLGQEKYLIAEGVKSLSQKSGLITDISCLDEDRIYGEEWIAFLTSCKTTLGTESGSNIFDFDGSIRSRIEAMQQRDPEISYEEVRNSMFGSHEEARIMNQISPRVFEAIQNGTALVLFEGRYSDVIEADKHYISLKKDLSNFDDVIQKVRDVEFLSQITQRAYRDVIASGRYSYKSFIASFDDALPGSYTENLDSLSKWNSMKAILWNKRLSDFPERLELIRVRGVYRKAWHFVPAHLRHVVKAAVYRFRALAGR